MVCVCVRVCVCVCSVIQFSHSVQSFSLTLCEPMHHNLPTSSVCGIFQARILEWVAISFSRGSFQPRDWTHISWVSCIGRQILYHCAPWEAAPQALGTYWLSSGVLSPMEVGKRETGKGWTIGKGFKKVTLGKGLAHCRTLETDSVCVCVERMGIMGSASRSLFGERAKGTRAPLVITITLKVCWSMWMRPQQDLWA